MIVTLIIICVFAGAGVSRTEDVSRISKEDNMFAVAFFFFKQKS